MGHKETSCLANVTCNSMEQQTMKVRPALLKRKSVDSDHLKQSNPRKNKSQQVRFKEDNTNTSDFEELEIKSGENTLLVNGKTEMCHDRSMCLLSHCGSQKGNQNIAIQTSPSLRKHFPISKTKKLIASNSLKQPSTESSCFQVNGDLEEEMVAQLCRLRIGEQLEKGVKRVRRHCPLKQTVPKAQSNGPISECSDMNIFEMVEKTTVSTQVPDDSFIGSASEECAESNFTSATDQTVHVYLDFSDRCKLNFSQPTDLQVCPTSKQREPKPQECVSQSKQNKSETSLPFIPNTECKRILTLTPSLNSNLSYCFHSEHQQAENPPKDSESTYNFNGNQECASNANNSGLQTNTTSVKGNRNNTTQLDSSQCCGGTEGISCLPKIETQYETNKESKQRNPGHKSHGKFCSLEGKLQTIEESLQSNQEKIKILLNVIQDLEKARALSEGRNFYRTGQDLNNCSTCQSTACIIYSVEYDFRQQEGRFHQVLQMLDKVEQTPLLAPVQKPEPENVIPEKQDLRKKNKKVKKKCFWWI
ncbi:protein INSYN2B [Rhinophrynus dorsalis]